MDGQSFTPPLPAAPCRGVKRERRKVSRMVSALCRGVRRSCRWASVFRASRKITEPMHQSAAIAARGVFAMNIETLRELLPIDLKPISGWPAGARAKFLDEWLQTEYQAPRAMRRQLLKEIESLTYREIVARYGRSTLSTAAAVALASANGKPEDADLIVEMEKATTEIAQPEQRQFTEPEYWAALEALAHFLKELTA